MTTPPTSMRTGMRPNASLRIELETGFPPERRRSPGLVRYASPTCPTDVGVTPVLNLGVGSPQIDPDLLGVSALLLQEEELLLSRTKNWS